MHMKGGGIYHILHGQLGMPIHFILNLLIFYVAFLVFHISHFKSQTDKYKINNKLRGGKFDIYKREWVGL